MFRNCGVFLLAGLFLVAGAALAQPAANLPSYQQPHQQQLRAIYKELVEINTTDSAGSCTEAAQAMAARLRAGGLPGDDVQVLAPPGAPKKGNLVARLRAAEVPGRARPSPAGRPVRRFPARPARRATPPTTILSSRAPSTPSCPGRDKTALECAP